MNTKYLISVNELKKAFRFPIYISRKLFLKISSVIFIMIYASSVLSQSGWQQMSDFYDVSLSKVVFLNENVGFSVGNYDGSHCMIYKTTNSGINWTSLSQPGGLNPCGLNSITFINSNTGFIVGGGSIAGQPIFMKTTDQGNSWVSQSITSAGNNYLNDIKFSDLFTGYICGSYGLILKTTNGGVNWIQQNSGTSISIRKIQLVQDNPQFIVATSYTPFILRSTNAGINWQTINFLSDEIISNLSFVNSQTGYVSGALSPFPYTAVIYKTTNGGDNWTSLTQNIPVGNQDNAIGFLNEHTGYLAARYIYRTTNGGNSWIPQESYPWWTIYGDIFFLNSNFISITCTWQSIYNGIILKTLNAGNSAPNPPTSLNGTRRININKFTWTDNSVCEDGFIVERKILPDTNWIQIDSLNSNQVTFYDTTEAALASYRISAINLIGKSAYSNECIPVLVSIDPSSTFIPSGFELFQNYPNPFNPNTLIKFGIPEKEFVRIVVYNYLGETLETLFKGDLSPGEYSLNFDGSTLASGTYFYRIITEKYSETKKMILIR